MKNRSLKLKNFLSKNDKSAMKKWKIRWVNMENPLSKDKKSVQ
jgi:hypothetical protein